jgi:osmoprotectant transport system permease protein
LITDQLLGLIESGVAMRRPRRVWVGVSLLFAGVAVAIVPTLSGGKSDYVIGAKNFSEQYILAELMADRLRDAGFSAQGRVGLGSVIAFRALASSEIDAYVDYSGTVWANVMNRTDTPSRAAMLEEMGMWLREKQGVTLLGALGFENAYALAMRRDRAEALGIRSMTDLARQAPQLSLGADFEFLDRPEWQVLSERYGIRFREQRQFQPTFMYRAVASAEVDVISAFSSDGRIAAYDLVVLTDPLQAVLPYDAILMLSPARASDAALKRALLPLVGAIPIDAMREANQRVDRDTDKLSPAAAARWLNERIPAVSP